jgi:hypothetical protein
MYRCRAARDMRRVHLGMHGSIRFVRSLSMAHPAWPAGPWLEETISYLYPKICTRELWRRCNCLGALGFDAARAPLLLKLGEATAL